jgi:phospholipid-translocating ATPase
MGILFPQISDESRKIPFGLQNYNNRQFSTNRVETSKYSILTFFPKAILFQFLRLSNVVYLVNAFLQSIPEISSLSPFTAIGPLIVVLAISLLR